MTTRRCSTRAARSSASSLVAVDLRRARRPAVLRADNLELMARQTAIVCIAALGMTMVIVSGGIDLSVGSIIALSTVVIALLLRSGRQPAGRGARRRSRRRRLCGLVNGVLITQLRVVPFIVTLGTMLVVRGAAKGLADERRIEAPMTLAERSAARAARRRRSLPSGHLGGDRARAARRRRSALHALRPPRVRDRIERADGAAVRRRDHAHEDARLHAVGARSPGVAGLLQFSKLSVGDPTVAVGLELDVIAAVIIGGGSLLGGRGTVVGTLIGAAIMTIIQIGCSQKGLANWVQQIVTGGIIVAAVALDRVALQPTCLTNQLMKIRDLEILDLRFPTSRTNDGTDAMHPDPDYSAAYVILKTDGGLEGHGFTFTIGRGNEVCVEAIRAFRRSSSAGRSRRSRRSPRRSGDRSRPRSQLRWLGPEKGVIHLSMAAIVNAVWDLHAKRERKPVWKLLADMTPRQIVACIDFRYITDALTPDEAIELLERQEPTKARARSGAAARSAIPAYTTSVGLDRLLGREDPRALPRGARRRVDALQGEGRRRAGRRSRVASRSCARRSGRSAR